MKTYKTVDEYISSYPKEVQENLEKIRKTIKKILPKAEEKISYGMPTYKQNKNVVHFAAFEKHFGLYPGPGAINFFKKELAKFETSKGTIRFPIDKVPPLSLITKITKYGLKQSETKSKSKAKKSK